MGEENLTDKGCTTFICMKYKIYIINFSLMKQNTSVSLKEDRKQSKTKINNEGFMEQKLDLTHQISEPKTSQKAILHQN